MDWAQFEYLHSKYFLALLLGILRETGWIFVHLDDSVEVIKSSAIARVVVLTDWILCSFHSIWVWFWA
ncbi:hypothetical protein BY996DRAFT_3268903 [Phakopsora pachyrhizi]|nr:hypothetical protein BY996DRAFT_3268903 [Phakopsora pachyrhizi]